MNPAMEQHLLYLSRKDVQLACQEIDTVSLLREVFYLHATGQTILPDEAYLSWTNVQGERARSLNMPSYIGAPFHAVGTKIINGNIANPERGQPRASGLTLLFDETSAHVVCAMEAAYISSLRTASVTVLAADLLTGNDIQDIAVIGAGVLAQTHIELLIARLPALKSIFIFDKDDGKTESLSARISPLLQERDIALRKARSAEEAIRATQLIIPVTTTTTGYIQFDWLQPGSLLVNISLDDPLAEVVLKADKVIVDDWVLVRNDSKRLLGRMYREGLIIGPGDQPQNLSPEPRRIDAELGDILTGTKEGRTTKDEIIMVNPFGLSIEDVAVAASVYQIACQRGLGTFLDY